MEPARLEAFTDGVVAIIITIMVLEIRVPHGTDLASLQADIPVLVAYLLSYEDPSSFFRAFHEWEGKPPREWRATQRRL